LAQKLNSPKIKFRSGECETVQTKETLVNAQRDFWNDWNAETREISFDSISIDQAKVIFSWLERLGRRDLKLIYVGCGAGWLCSQLAAFGQVTGTDLSDEVLARAAIRMPDVRFIAGDFSQLDLGNAEYDVVVSLEVLSHVADQRAFMEQVSNLLTPDGYFMIATQNRPALPRNTIPPPKPGQLRRWVDHKELQDLLNPHFRIEEMFSITPRFNRGALRILNSRKVRRMAGAVGMDYLAARVDKWQERAWLGWTLMALAQTRGN
jgi:2-polyprenyl-3-methyl-5-hydroxy-6-metoxy-1,4-benzoquinol methylase